MNLTPLLSSLPRPEPSTPCDDPRHPARETWLRWALLPVLIFLVARIASGLMLWALSEDVAPLPGAVAPIIAEPAGAGELLTAWDANWYRLIIEHGYPDQLPRDEWGTVQMNAYAFYPGYPVVAKALTYLGLSTPWAQVLVSLGFGAGAVVLLYRLLRPHVGRFSTLLTVTAVSFGSTSFILGAGYTESMAMFWILLALTFVHRRSPLGFLAVALALSLTRAVVPALAAVVGVVWVVRWLRRDREPFELRERLVWAGVGVVSAASFLLWPGIVALRTGQWDAYLATQRAWNWGADGWVTWLSSAFTDIDSALVVFPILAAMLALAWHTVRWPVEARAWVVLYPLYIFGSTLVYPSLARYLTLLIFPAWPFPSWSERLGRGARVALVVAVCCAGMALQWVWIRDYWIPTPMGKVP